MILHAHKHIPFWLRVLLVLAWMGMIFGLSSVPSLQSGLPSIYDLVLRKAAHMGEYFVLALLIWFLIAEAKMFFGVKLLLVFVCTFFYAVSDEFHQTFIPGRHGAAQDVMIDSIGIIGAMVLLKVQHRLGV